VRILKITIVFIVFLIINSNAQNSFTEKDRRVLLELSVKMNSYELRLIELREDMNKRFEQVDKRFEQVDKRLEQVDRRFEQVENSIDRIYTVLTILSGIFAAVMAGMFWLLYADRKPQEKAIEQMREKISILETSNLMGLKMLSTLKELATKDERIKEALMHNNLI